MSRAAEIAQRLRAWEPTTRQRERLKWAGYVLYTLLAVIFFIWLSLPRKAISTAITTKLSGLMGREISAESVSLAGLTGVTFENLRIVRGPGLAWEIPEQTIRLGLFAWLGGGLDLSATSRFEEESRGQLDIRNDEKQLSLHIDLAGMALDPFFPDRGPEHILLHGSAGGTLDYQSPGLAQLRPAELSARLLDAKGAQGSVNLTLQDGRLANLTVGGFPMPPLRYEQLQVSVKLAEERLTIESLNLRGPDADLSASGTLALSEPLGRSRLNLRMELTPRGEFAQQYSGLLATQMKQESDGKLSGFLQGPLASLRMQK